ncbi:MAG: DUF255 domain-containing protein [Proteobacteria bacterium]|nr:DUF255 domain-containing protein [Pseudomonadota bacterium]
MTQKGHVAGSIKPEKPYNRLIFSKSPYLLQHAINPVDWYPWGEEAFEKAQKEKKPIFLSIGYSTCHWCHVMAHESFEDPEVARLMNDAFVSIKVDREERPDIDSIYMTVCQMMTGSGGWPLTIIMMPDKKPFFAGTYFPKESRYGRIGMLDLIPRVKELWVLRREEILESADKITASLKQVSHVEPGEEPGESTLRVAFEQLAQRYDREYGGFGDAPKFPTPHNLLFLLRHWNRTGDEKALLMVEETLRAMRRGGIYDQVGLGFHRYSTDQKWLVPHFEKMLYDQAMVAIAYIEAYQATGKGEYREATEEIFTYVLRDMTASSGGFYSGEDADSEGEEGKFYVWTEEEVRQTLSPQEADLAIKVFNIEREGNYNEEATGRRTGTNVLHKDKELRDKAADLKMSEEELRKILEGGRQKLFAAREKRVRPHKDDKVLVDWNGLMIAALAKGARVFDEPRYVKSAREAVDFILKTMRGSDGRLFHRYRDGEVAGHGLVDDYAFFIWGLIELYETTFETRYLEMALNLTDDMIRHFWDNQEWGFYLSADDGEKILIRKKEIYDGAIPSGNSVAALNLLRLGRITANPDFEDKAMKIGRAFSAVVGQSPSAFTQFLLALDFGLGPSHEVIIAGNSAGRDTQAMLRAIRGQFVPNKVVILRPADADSPDIVRFADFTRHQSPIDGKATAYVCLNYKCEFPTTDVGEMLELLDVRPR